MNCDNAILLVEKLADGETSAEETALAEKHVAACADCRSHYAFVKGLVSVSETFELLPEPPQAYWDHLPAKIVARLREDERPGFWRQLFAPSVLRWGALAATLLVVVAVGVSVTREGDLAVETPAQDKVLHENEADIVEELEAPLEEPEDVEDVEGGPAALLVAPPVVSPPAPRTARDEAPRPQEPGDAGSDENDNDAEKLRQRLALASPARAKNQAADAPASSLRAERGEGFEASGVAIESSEPTVLIETITVEPEPSVAEADAPGDPAEFAYRELSSDSRPDVAGRRDSAVSVENCGRWRDYLERYPDASRATDALYELARCALGGYDAAPSVESRDAAIRDADRFLAEESDGPRADEIRERAAPLRRR